MTEYFLYTTPILATNEQEQEINRKIKDIDPSASFCAVEIPGNHTHGWIVRPNDGTNEHNHVKATNQKMAEIAESILRS